MKLGARQEPVVSDASKIANDVRIVSLISILLLRLAKVEYITMDTG